MDDPTVKAPEMLISSHASVILQCHTENGSSAPHPTPMQAWQVLTRCACLLPESVVLLCTCVG